MIPYKIYMYIYISEIHTLGLPKKISKLFKSCRCCRDEENANETRRAQDTSARQGIHPSVKDTEKQTSPLPLHSIMNIHGLDTPSSTAQSGPAYTPTGFISLS